MQHGSALDRESIGRLISSPPTGQPPLVENLSSLDEQLQPNGLDFTTLRVDRLSSAGSMGAAAGSRSLAQTHTLPAGPDGWLHLEAGCYLVTFQETVNLPLDLMGLAFPRSSLLRSGVSMNTAVWDAGYRGRSQALLNVHNLLRLPYPTGRPADADCVLPIGPTHGGRVPGPVPG